MAVNPHVFVKVKGVYRGSNPGPETEGLTPEEMLVNVEAIESVQHGSPNKHGGRNGVLLTSAG